MLAGLYLLVFIYGFAIAFRSRSHFGRLLALGLTVNVFLYVFINTGMVMGLLPVVGVPLPLISYGGTVDADGDVRLRPADVRLRPPRPAARRGGED